MEEKTLLAKKVGELGMNVEEFAKKAGITIDEANRALNGTFYPHHSKLMQILRAVGCDILTGNHNDPWIEEGAAIITDMRNHRNKSRKSYDHQDPKLAKEGKKNEEETLFEKKAKELCEEHFEDLLSKKLEETNNARNDIFIEVLRERLIKMVDAAVFDDEPFAAERMDRLSELYYQINCTLYILHRFKSKGITPKIKECTLYEEQQG